MQSLEALTCSGMHTKLAYSAGGGLVIGSCFTIGRHGVPVGLSSCPALIEAADVISARQPASKNSTLRIYLKDVKGVTDMISKSC